MPRCLRFYTVGRRFHRRALGPLPRRSPRPEGDGFLMLSDHGFTAVETGAERQTPGSASKVIFAFAPTLRPASPTSRRTAAPSRSTRGESTCAARAASPPAASMTTKPTHSPRTSPRGCRPHPQRPPRRHACLLPRRNLPRPPRPPAPPTSSSWAATGLTRRLRFVPPPFSPTPTSRACIPGRMHSFGPPRLSPMIQKSPTSPPPSSPFP